MKQLIEYVWEAILPLECASYLGLVYTHTVHKHPPPSPYGYGELLPRPSGGGVIYMKEGIQIYYNDQLGGRSPKGSDAIGDWVEDINK